MQIQMVRAGVYFSSVLDERPEHKANYVPSSEGAARGQKDGRAGGYVESSQGVTDRGEGRGIGLTSRINLKIGTKKGVPGRWGFGPVEARFYRHSMGWQSASRHGKSLRVYALTGCLWRRPGPPFRVRPWQKKTRPPLEMPRCPPLPRPREDAAGGGLLGRGLGQRLPHHVLRLTTYERVGEYLQAFAQGHFHLMILVGAGGLAKSRSVRGTGRRHGLLDRGQRHALWHVRQALPAQR